MDTQRSVFDLDAAEKLQLVQDLWDDLAEGSDEIPVHDWQKQELDRRKANLRQNEISLLSWDQVKARLRAGRARTARSS